MYGRRCVREPIHHLFMSSVWLSPTPQWPKVVIAAILDYGSNLSAIRCRAMRIDGIFNNTHLPFHLLKRFHTDKEVVMYLNRYDQTPSVLYTFGFHSIPHQSSYFWMETDIVYLSKNNTMQWWSTGKGKSYAKYIWWIIKLSPLQDVKDKIYQESIWLR